MLVIVELVPTILASRCLALLALLPSMAGFCLIDAGFKQKEKQVPGSSVGGTRDLFRRVQNHRRIQEPFKLQRFT